MSRLWAAVKRGDGTILFAVVALALVLVGIGITKASWDWLHMYGSADTSNDNMVPNAGIWIGGAVALVFGLWRAWLARRQADAARDQAKAAQDQVTASQVQVEAVQRQVEITQTGLLNERYQRAAEMLGSELLTVRLGAVYALRRLAAEHPVDYQVQCMVLLCAFVRHPTPDERVPISVTEEWGRENPIVREDVQAAVSAIGERNPDHLELERQNDFRVDLRRASLVAADLRQHPLVCANLEGARLMSADLDQAMLTGADLSYAHLSGANLSGVCASDAICLCAKLSGVTAQGTILRGAILEGTEWNGARMQGADLSNANLIGADLQAARLNGTNLSGTIFGRGRRLIGPTPFETTQVIHTRLTQAQLSKDLPETVTRPNCGMALVTMKPVYSWFGTDRARRIASVI